MIISKTIKDNSGVTLFEILIAVGIIGFMAAVSLGIYGNLLFTSQIDEGSYKAIQMMRTAKERSVGGFNDSQHGIYLDINPAGDDRIILFQGSSYAARDADYDSILPLKSIFNLSTTITGNEFVFSKGFGIPNNTGSIVITHTEGGSRTITVNSYGLIEEN